MAFGYQFNDLKNGNSIPFDTQKKAACGIIEYIFNKTDMNDFKDMFFRYYETIAFKKPCDIPDPDKEDYYEKTVKYKQQEFKISKREWGGPAFWFFRIFVCCDMEAVKKNIDAIRCYEDLERYKNGLFDIKHLKPLDEKKRKQLEEVLKKIRDSRNTDSNFSAGDKSESISIQEIRDARNKMAFCDENIVETLNTSKIVDLLVGGNGIFPVAMRDILKERYLKMRKNFKEPWEKDDCWKQEIHERTFNIVHGSSDALLKIPASICKCTLTEKIFANATNIGHDLPIWLYYDKKDAQRRRVMIISQDPKRAGHSGNDLLLSTPWAHHSIKFLSEGNVFQQLAVNVIHSYQKQGAIVYLTDFKKLYCEPEENNDSLDERYTAILKQEVEFFKPNVIIIIGKKAAKELTGSNKYDVHYTRLAKIGYEGDIYVKRHTSNSNGSNEKGTPSYVTDYWLREGRDRLGSGPYIIEDILNKNPGQR